MLGLRLMDAPGGGGGAFLYDGVLESIEFDRVVVELVEDLWSRAELGERPPLPPREACTIFSDALQA